MVSQDIIDLLSFKRIMNNECILEVTFECETETQSEVDCIIKVLLNSEVFL